MAGKERENLKFDKEFETLIPPLTESEFNALTDSIIDEGCRDPLVIWNKIILDGHNRYNICKKNGIIFKIVEKNFDDREQAKVWILENQLGRRNLNEAQRIDVVDKLFGLKEKQDAKDRQLSRDRSGKFTTTVEKFKSRDKLGKKAKVSGKTYEKGITVKTEQPKIWDKCLQGEISIDKAYKETKKHEKQRKINEKIAEGKNIKISADLRLGDFKKVLDDIPDNSIDIIITDPPYPEKYLYLFEELSEFAKKKLKPSGFCISYSGHIHLPMVLQNLGKYLDYYWIFCLYHTGSTQIVQGRNVIAKWKPILFFQKKPFKKFDETVSDYIRSDKREKDLHEWQQGVNAISELIEYFTEPGDIVCDPFVGGGTTLFCAKQLKRNCIGAEIDENTFYLAKERLKDE